MIIASKISPVIRWGFARSYLARLNPLEAKYHVQQPEPHDEIVVAMSSGVDSSVAAAMLAESHPNVRGIYMANWSQTAKCTEQDWNDVQQVCRKIGIPCERVNFEREYWNSVFVPMLEGYRQGVTPNPDVGCNRYVKFGGMIQHLSRKFSRDGKTKWWFATGHYARVAMDTESKEYCLLRGLSPAKDQSYYLSSIDPKVLPRLLMPIGHYEKHQIRDFARKRGLHVASKPDSQGLCFVSPEHSRFEQFLDEYIAPNPGNVITADGKIWGRHQGIWHATVGQRARISMPQGDPKYQGVWFVSEKRPQTNELVIVRGSDNPQLYKRQLAVDKWHWLTTLPSVTDLTIQTQSLRLANKIAEIEWERNEPIKMTLEEPVRAISPGQVAVLYDKSRVLGCATITGAQ